MKKRIIKRCGGTSLFPDLRAKRRRKHLIKRGKGIMSQCVVPNWVVRHELRQEPDEQGEEGKRSTHVHMNRHDPRPHPHPPPPIIPIMNRGLAELAWEKGNLTILHGLGELPQCGPAKQAWVPRARDTLESVVHQATTGIKRNSPASITHMSPAPNVDSSVVATSAAKWPENSYDGGRAQRRPDSVEKLENQEWATRKKQCSREEVLDHHEFTNTSITGNDTATTTWLSFESPNSLKTKTTEDDSTSHGGMGNPDHEEVEKNTEIRRTHSSRRIRAAAIHNQSERKRRDRINQKMKALQKLVPNSSKTDKASILDEVIAYLKQLQAQLQLMSTARSCMPQLMMPLGMQQLQMSLMARMAGMGLGLGMGMSTTATHPPTMPTIFHPSTSQPSPAFVPPFLLPSLLPTHTAPPPAKTDTGTSPGGISSPDPYSAFVAQSMNMDLFNKMTTLFRQQMGLPASANPQSHAKESGT